MTTFYSNGKLLLTGEYVVLDGALSLALPTQKGQSLHLSKIDKPLLVWKSLDHKQNIWFSETFDLMALDSSLANSETTNMLLTILQSAKALNPSFLNDNIGYEVTTILEFDKNWGLGSSSTLINNIASWAKIDAYKLLDSTFGGSGYDIACAQAIVPITYLIKNNVPTFKPIAFYPKFSECLYFVHLNKKQNSREGIARYKANKRDTEEAISKITAITKLIINCDALMTFEALITKHEAIISKLIKLPIVKESLFSDYKGAIKSLGAWGGDFILVTSKSDPTTYFKQKGYHTIIPYKKMVLN